MLCVLFYPFHELVRWILLPHFTNEETEIPKIEWLIEDHTTENGGEISSLVLFGLYRTNIK